MLNPDELRAAIVAPLQELARAREYAVSTVDIPAPRPESDFCPTCGGSQFWWPAWVSMSERCSSPWHNQCVNCREDLDNCECN